jgi:hypothetical protein
MEQIWNMVKAETSEIKEVDSFFTDAMDYYEGVE